MHGGPYEVLGKHSPSMSEPDSTVKSSGLTKSLALTLTGSAVIFSGNSKQPFTRVWSSSGTRVSPASCSGAEMPRSWRASVNGWFWTKCLSLGGSENKGHAAHLCISLFIYLIYSYAKEQKYGFIRYDCFDRYDGGPSCIHTSQKKTSYGIMLFFRWPQNLF